MLVGYARVSTTDQHFDLQKDALLAAGCERIFTDTASGAKAERQGLTDALEHLRPAIHWIREITKKYARRAGITKRIHLHLFRHQILTYLTSKGIVNAKSSLSVGTRTGKAWVFAKISA